MMRINFVTGEYDVGFNIKQFNYIFSYNGGGKTSFCKVLKDGFEGKLSKKFLLDGNLIGKTDYSVYMINDIDTIDVEKSLSSKSILKDKIAKQVTDVEDEILCLLDNYINQLKKEVSDHVFNQLDTRGLSLDLDFKITDLISKFSSITVDQKTIDSMSLSERRMAYIDLVINEIRNSTKPCILVIDEVDLSFSSVKFNYLMKLLISLSEETNCIVFVASSKVVDIELHKIYVDLYKIENQLYTSDELIESIALDEECSVEDVKKYYLEEEITNYISENQINRSLELKFLGKEKK